MLSLQKNSFHFFHFPIFHSKIHKRSETFFERGILLKGWGEGSGVHVKRTRTKKPGRRSKIGSFERTYFLNDFHDYLANRKQIVKANDIYMVYNYNIPYIY